MSTTDGKNGGSGATNEWQFAFEVLVDGGVPVEQIVADGGQIIVRIPSQDQEIHLRPLTFDDQNRHARLLEAGDAYGVFFFSGGVSDDSKIVFAPSPIELAPDVVALYLEAVHIGT